MKIPKGERQEIKAAYLFILPLVAGLLIFYIYSFLQNFYSSFTEFGAFGKPKFVGFENYIRMVTDPEFYMSLRNTMAFVLIGVPGVVFFSTIAALLLNEKIYGKTFFRTALFLPAVTLPAAIGILWKWLFNGQYGLFNLIFARFGLPTHAWLTEGDTVLVAISIVLIWSMISTNMIIILSGLQTISSTYYDAAKIDGASGRQTLFKITLPLLSPNIFFVTIMASIGIFQIFDFIFLMIRPNAANMDRVQSLVYFFYENSFIKNNLKGYGSAISMIIFLIIFIITIIQFKLQKKWVHYN
jgi:multiple sugar transport system permease protein